MIRRRFESHSRGKQRKRQKFAVVRTLGYIRMVLNRRTDAALVSSSDFRDSTMSHKQIYYSDKYDDDKYEYRHVMLPKEIAKRVPKTHLMSETEWRNLGVQQSQGWVHYMIHQPEPHILLFRRPLPNQKS
ncbi:Cyclin-dependent kinases regulatory subunit 1 [Oryzias melastigma]|uniref:Cyclin-dependent kinases regulatory subunit n=1 Tax=Oryzias melastigma TaxID=30732 RepID=A0A834C0N4_ORYME|nr:Cyclin-dependent kinases regulatory subunit 1 [Oryzias melastigma]